MIKGGTQRALRSDAREHGARTTFETILRETDRMDRLVDDLLAIQRIRPGRAILHCMRFDLGPLVRSVVDETAQTTTERRFRLHVQGGLMVNADRALIETAIRHLLEHATSYTPEEGLIEVDAAAIGGRAVISVTRQGPRIPRERQSHIFKPFYEPIPPGEPGYVGAASLGLYLSKRIVEAHGGRIGLTTGPGDQETLWFSLPLT